MKNKFLFLVVIFLLVSLTLIQAQTSFGDQNVITPNADGASSVYAIDLDGDSDIDVLSASAEDDKIVWYENNGSQSFTAHAITTDADRAWDVYAIDLDGDGDIDVLSASAYDDKIAWYENGGDQSFTAMQYTRAPIESEGPGL